MLFNLYSTVYSTKTRYLKLKLINFSGFMFFGRSGLQAGPAGRHCLAEISRDISEKDVWMAAHVAPKPACTFQHQVTASMISETI